MNDQPPMKMLFMTMLFLCITVIAQEGIPGDQITKASEGLRQLCSELREPDSFSLDRAWIAHGEKHGTSICYTYRARNGFGGMNYSAASYVANKKGQYMLNVATDSWNGPTGNISDPIPGGVPWFTRCSDRAMRKQTLTDITQDVRKALVSTPNPAR